MSSVAGSQASHRPFPLFCLSLQDLAARGVSLVYSRGGSGLQQQLLGQLLGLLQGSTATAGGPGTTAAGAAGVKLTGDTKIFEEGQLGNTPGVEAFGGGGVTSYTGLYMHVCTVCL